MSGVLKGGRWIFPIVTIRRRLIILEPAEGDLKVADAMDRQGIEDMHGARTNGESGDGRSESVSCDVVSPWRNAWTPPGCRVYAIGDIHGRADLLLRLLRRIEDDSRDRPGAERQVLVFLGDYVDRGFYSRSVIDIMLRYLPDGFTPVFLKGNHEVLLLEYLNDPCAAELWVGNGGLATLESYDVDWESAEYTHKTFRAQLPRRHRAFFEALRPSTIIGDYFFCHAGVMPGVPLEEQSEKSLLWIRGDFLDYPGDFGKVVVHGHTPRPVPQDRPNRIGVDTRAWQSGKLTAVVLESDRRRFLTT
jgi:serine/threonine protein phosphatase 1